MGKNIKIRSTIRQFSFLADMMMCAGTITTMEHLCAATTATIVYIITHLGLWSSVTMASSGSISTCNLESMVTIASFACSPVLPTQSGSGSSSEEEEDAKKCFRSTTIFCGWLVWESSFIFSVIHRNRVLEPCPNPAGNGTKSRVYPFKEALS